MLSNISPAVMMIMAFLGKTSLPQSSDRHVSAAFTVMLRVFDLPFGTSAFHQPPLMNLLLVSPESRETGRM